MITGALKTPLTLFLGAFVLYAIVMSMLYLFQRKMIYYPAPDRQNRAVYKADDMEAIHVTTADGLTLEGWYKAPRDGKPVIVVFHGNASHMGMSAWKVRPYLDAGYGALLPAYRGYAGNPGKPSEQGLYKDAAAFLDWLAAAQGMAQGRIVLLGESLGSGVAIEMAAGAYRGVAGIILESPYTSFSDLAAHHYSFLPFASHLVRDRYENIAKIAAVKAPLLIVHGRRDVVVPFAQGERLYEAAPGQKQMAAIDSAGHNDLYLFGADKAILEFLAHLPQ